MLRKKGGMSQFTNSTVIPEEYKGLAGSNLDITATHYTNFILLQIRLNGELDSTFEVTCRRSGLLLAGAVRPPIATDEPQSSSMQSDDESISELDFVRDNMSDFDVVAKLGDSNNVKLQVICTQIAELYNSVIVPGLLGADNPNRGRNMIITLSTKLVTRGADSNPEDFGRLVLLLQSIKAMYTS